MGKETIKDAKKVILRCVVKASIRLVKITLEFGELMARGLVKKT